MAPPTPQISSSSSFILISQKGMSSASCRGHYCRIAGHLGCCIKESSKYCFLMWHKGKSSTGGEYLEWDKFNFITLYYFFLIRAVVYFFLIFIFISFPVITSSCSPINEKKKEQKLLVIFTD